METWYNILNNVDMNNLDMTYPTAPTELKSEWYKVFSTAYFTTQVHNPHDRSTLRMNLLRILKVW